MKRHLLVTNDFPPKVGGIQNYLWDLWKRLDPASFVVLTGSSDVGAAAFDAQQAERGVHIERVPASTLFFPTPAALAAVRTCVAENEVDLVLLDPVLPLGLLGPRLGVPYGVILHGAEVTVPGRIPGSRSRARRRAARGGADRVGGQLPGGGRPPRRVRPHRPARGDPTGGGHRRDRPVQGGGEAGRTGPARAARADPSSSASAGWCRARAWTC